MCFVFAGPTISPTNLPVFPVSPVTQDTIVPAVLLGVFTVLGFLAIFILLFITLCLYNKKSNLELEKKTMEQKLTYKENNLQQQIKNLEEKNCELKINLEHQISSASDVDNPIGLQFVKIATEIMNLCSRSAHSDMFYLNAVANIMQSMSKNCTDARSRALVRTVRNSAEELFDKFSEEEWGHISSEPANCGDNKVCCDDVSDLDSAKDFFKLYLGKLDAILQTEG